MKKELDNYLVEKYPKIFINRNGDMTETGMCWGFQHNNGWFWLIDQLCDSIQNYIDINNSFRKEDNKIQQVVATSIKEKYGILSFNYYNGDNLIDGMTRLAENMSANTCEFCGSIHDVGATSGWIYTICKDCYTKTTEKRISSLPWKLNKNSLSLPKIRKIKLDILNNVEKTK